MLSVANITARTLKDFKLPKHERDTEFSAFEGYSGMESRLLSVFGDAGRRWLSDLPTLLDDCETRLGLMLQSPYPNLTYHYVAPAVSEGGKKVVLKLGVPDREFTNETQALSRFAGDGCVNILFADADRGVLLLERLTPGLPLTNLATEKDDSRATSIVCSVIRGLHQNREYTEHDLQEFDTVSKLGRGFPRLRLKFDGDLGPFPRKLVDEAIELWADLESTAGKPVLLHGDLHHDNIISADRAPWLAIDPKGYVGEPAFETGAILRNLWQDRHKISNPAQLIERRIYQLADELDLDRERVRGWGVAQAVLVMWWSYEDNDPNWAESLEIAEMIAGIKV